jgi:hypothetical protein
MKLRLGCHGEVRSYVQTWLLPFRLQRISLSACRLGRIRAVLCDTLAVCVTMSSSTASQSGAVNLSSGAGLLEHISPVPEAIVVGAEAQDGTYGRLKTTPIQELLCASCYRTLPTAEADFV